VVLLLNGWTASGLVWPGDWLARLERRYRVVRVDNRGTGWSRTAPAPFTIGDMAEDAAEVLRGIGAGPATVLGLSMGGMIAQELALRHPELVGQLVLVGTRPPARSYIPAAAPVLDRELDHLLGSAPARQTSLEAFYRSIWEPQCAPGFADCRPELFDELVAQIVTRPTPRAAVINQLRAIAAWSGSSRLATIKAPTVVVHGALDELMPVGTSNSRPSGISSRSKHPTCSPRSSKGTDTNAVGGRAHRSYTPTGLPAKRRLDLPRCPAPVDDEGLACAVGRGIAGQE